MNILEFGEVVFFILLMYGLFTQVIMPSWKGTPSFPIFRRRRRLEADLRHAREDAEDEKLVREIEETRPKDSKQQ